MLKYENNPPFVGWVQNEDRRPKNEDPSKSS